MVLVASLKMKTKAKTRFDRGIIIRQKIHSTKIQINIYKIIVIIIRIGLRRPKRSDSNYHYYYLVNLYFCAMNFLPYNYASVKSDLGFCFHLKTCHRHHYFTGLYLVQSSDNPKNKVNSRFLKTYMGYRS